MKKALSLFFILLLVFLFLSCGGSEKKPATPDDPTDTEAVDTDTDTDPADSGDTTAATCGNRAVDEGEVCDGGAKECREIDPSLTGYAYCSSDCTGWDTTGCQANQDPADSSDTDSSDTGDTDTGIAPYTDMCDPNNDGEIKAVFEMGAYSVNVIDVNAGDNGAPRQFRIYEPTGAEGKIPVIHFLHGFMYKIGYYDNILTHLASHGFVVVSSQSNHSMTGGDTTIVEAGQVITLINWLKQNLQSKLTVTADLDNFGLSGHSRGGKVTNRVLNTDPAIARSFFGVDPVDSAPPVGGASDPNSLNDPVQFKAKSFFLGTEKGPEGLSACAPASDGSAHFYSSYPSPSRHIIAAGVGHADMVDDQSECGLYCSLCAKSGDTALNQQFMSYTGGLMAAFFNSSLKCETQYEKLLDDVASHPFKTTLAEHK